MKKFVSIVTYITLLLTGSAYAEDISVKVVNLDSLSTSDVQNVTFRDKEGICQYSGEAVIKKQSRSLMRVFSAAEKKMLISISSKRCNQQVTAVKLYASPDQERINKSISVLGTSSKILIPQGSEFFLSEEKTELGWYEKNN